MNCLRRLMCWQSTRVEGRRVREPRRTALSHGSHSGFMVMRLVSGLSLTDYSDSESFLVMHASLSQDGCQWTGFWEVVGHMMSPFDLSQTLPGGGGLLVPGSLPGSPVLKQLMQMVTMVPGHVVSVSVLPLTLTCMKKNPFCPNLYRVWERG